MRGMHSTIEVGFVRFVDHLLELWIGKESHFNAFSENMCLTAGQVFLVFVVVFFTFSLAVLIFCCEVLHKKMEVGYSEEVPQL